MTAPTSATGTAVSVRASPAVLWAAWACAAAWFALHAQAPAWPPRSVWGIEMWEVWPVHVRWLIAGGLTVLVAPPLLVRWTAGIHRAFAWTAERNVPAGIRAAMAVAFGVLCWIGRTGNIYHGDGIVTAKVARTTSTMLHYLGYNDGRATAEQVVEFCIHRGINMLVGARLGLESYETVALTHAVCGGIMLWLLTAVFAAWWPGAGRRQLAATAMFLSLGVVQLWFGHIETYTIASTACVGFVWAGSRVLRGRTDLWEPALWATAAMTVHPVFGGLMLGQAWLWFVRARRAAWPERIRTAVWLVLPVAFMIAAWITAYRALGFSWEMIAGFLGRSTMTQGATFVPLHVTHNVMERYTFFSGAHAADLLNESLLTAPYALAVLLVCGALRGTRMAFRTPEAVFLAASTAVYLTVIIVVNPPGGGRREWDVFSPPAVGYGLLAIYVLFTGITAPGTRRAVAALCTVAGLAHTAPWVITNARIDLPVYIEHKAAGDRARANRLPRSALAEYREALRILPSPDVAAGCGDLERALGDYHAALATYRQAIAWENRSELAAFGAWEHVLVSSGEIYETLGDDTRARETFLEAIAVGDGRRAVFVERGAAYAGLGRVAERAGERAAALEWYTSALRLEPDSVELRAAVARLGSADA